MILFTAQESSALPTLAETQAVAAEVHEDLQQLKPNAILESIKSWTPGLLSLAYRLFVAALIIFIGSRIALYISHCLGKSKEHRPNPIIQMDLFMDGDGFKRVSDDKSVDISKLPEDDKGLYYKDEPYTTKKLQQRLIITYSPKYALYQKSIRSKQIERAQAMLDSGNTKRTAGTQTIQPDLLEQQQLQKKVRLPISSIILMNIRSLKKASMMDFMQYARTC